MGDDIIDCPERETLQLGTTLRLTRIGDPDPDRPKRRATAPRLPLQPRRRHPRVQR
jgi:hypothetical protein